MKRKQMTRIMELRLKRSKKNPNLCHVIALLVPCSHKKYLGLTKTPKGMEGNFKRVESVTIWTPSHYSVADKEGCFSCPNEDLWIREWPKLDELREVQDDLDFGD